MNIDGTLIETDRSRTPGPTEGVAPWWSGIHENHGGNIQVVTAPDGWPIWTSEVRPAANMTPPVSPAAGADLRTLSDLGYESLANTITVAFKKPKNGGLLLVQQRFNKAHNSLRAIGERVNSLLKMTFRALRTSASTPGGSGRSSPPPWSSSTSNTTAPHNHHQ